jgi:hypothetical protein
MNDGVKAHGYAARMTDEFDERGQLLHSLLPRGNSRFHARTPKAGDGEMAVDLGITGKSLAEAALIG